MRSGSTLCLTSISTLAFVMSQLVITELTNMFSNIFAILFCFCALSVLYYTNYGVVELACIIQQPVLPNTVPSLVLLFDIILVVLLLLLLLY